MSSMAIHLAEAASVKVLRGPDFGAHPITLIAVKKEPSTLQATGPQGPRGIQGLPGPSVKGDKGDKGDPGVGVQGVPGPPVDTTSLTLDGGFF